MEEVSRTAGDFAMHRRGSAKASPGEGMCLRRYFLRVSTSWAAATARMGASSIPMSPQSR